MKSCCIVAFRFSDTSWHYLVGFCKITTSKNRLCVGYYLLRLVSWNFANFSFGNNRRHSLWRYIAIQNIRLTLSCYGRMFVTNIADEYDSNNLTKNPNIYIVLIAIKNSVDPDVIRTRSLLIWSQTRYRCATESHIAKTQYIFISWLFSSRYKNAKHLLAVY